MYFTNSLPTACRFTTALCTKESIRYCYYAQPQKLLPKDKYISVHESLHSQGDLRYHTRLEDDRRCYKGADEGDYRSEQLMMNFSLYHLPVIGLLL